MVKAAEQNSTNTFFFLGDHLSQMLLLNLHPHTQTYPLFSSTDSIHVCVLCTTSNITGKRAKALWGITNEEDHSMPPAEGTTLTALSRWSNELSSSARKAARQGQTVQHTEKGTQPTFNTYTLPVLKGKALCILVACRMILMASSEQLWASC